MMGWLWGQDPPTCRNCGARIRTRLQQQREYCYTCDPDLDG